MKKRKLKNPIKLKTLQEVEKDRKAYNEKHGTCLSYGQYVAMCEGLVKC